MRNCSRRRFEQVVNEAHALIATKLGGAKLFAKQLAALLAKPASDDEEAAEDKLDLERKEEDLKRAKVDVSILDDFLKLIDSTWSDVYQRIVGWLDWAPKIANDLDIALKEDKFLKNFKGNYNLGYVDAAGLANPYFWDEQGNPCFIVAKNGQTTDLTLVASPSWKLTRVTSSSTIRGMSLSSTLPESTATFLTIATGACVFGAKGKMVAILDSGMPRGMSNHVTFCTPAHYVVDLVRERYPHTDLDRLKFTETAASNLKVPFCRLPPPSSLSSLTLSMSLAPNAWGLGASSTPGRERIHARSISSTDSGMTPNHTDSLVLQSSPHSSRDSYNNHLFGDPAVDFPQPQGFVFGSDPLSIPSFGTRTVSPDPITLFPLDPRQQPPHPSLFNTTPPPPPPRLRSDDPVNTQFVHTLALMAMIRLHNTAALEEPLSYDKRLKAAEAVVSVVSELTNSEADFGEFDMLIGHCWKHTCDVLIEQRSRVLTASEASALDHKIDIIISQMRLLETVFPLTAFQINDILQARQQSILSTAPTVPVAAHVATVPTL
ncbi:uncharacterized protein EI90DRAFT_3134825 [Cantharellus anzutake]|uniref:uncharacterized protein n=1 Tax=Cantharellus anzutake TaxID=1750568 RepID=UPI001905448E|nr:uncharacterized protein EI90DRAFT_3134825 [Cantharellus anzutake]KAF8315990.1 hypothetical protein EI90DRAFT_3134825 [Cantharellus anzutake]